MCGIAGLVDANGLAAERAASIGAALCTAMAHRGPDGEGVYVASSSMALLAHRRLAIIGLGPTGAQPMASDDERYWLVFNGEIYNHQELRRTLADPFRGHSDTEVLLRLLVRDGVQALPRLRGMFALALWDEQERSLLLARDRFGIKPLYVSASPHALSFASEIAALRRAGLAGTEPSPAGLLAFLAWGSIPPPLTWLRSVSSLAPGTWWRWRTDDTTTTGTFADVRDCFVTGTNGHSGQPLRERIAAALEDSVRAHLVADVPVGLFLSGGIDSSTIASAAHAIGHPPLSTYTVHFTDGPGSEASIAEEVARRFGSHHRTIPVDRRQIVRDLPEIVASLDQPTLDAVNSFYVSRAVASEGIKVVLSGTGADELFGGYSSFQRIPRAMRLGRVLGQPARAAALLAGIFPTDTTRSKWRHALRGLDRPAALYRSQRGLFMPEEWPAIAGEALRGPQLATAIEELDAAERALLEPTGPEVPVASVARMECRLYLGSQLLRDLDVMSMAHALEVRVPFVDGPLADAVWPSMGADTGLMTNKRVLYEGLRHPLPPSVYQRPKQGFSFPFDTWLRGELGPVVRAGIDRAADHGWIDRAAGGAAWTSFLQGRSHWSRPWTLGILGHFLEHAA